MKEKIVGYDGLVAGVTYAVGQGGFEVYKPIHCPLNGANCHEHCVLYVKSSGKCRYRLSLESSGEVYRELDNALLFESSTFDPSKEEPLVEKPMLVVGALREADIASQIPPPSTPTLENEVDGKLKELEKYESEQES